MATQAFTLRPAETVEDAIAPAPATETTEPAPAVSVYPNAKLAQCAQSTGVGLHLDQAR